MSRFNATIARPSLTENLAGGKAYRQDAKNELAGILLTSFVNDKFYRSAAEEMARVKELVAADPKFAAQAAVYARNEFGMRSISHIVAAEVVHAARGPRPEDRPPGYHQPSHTRAQEDAEWVKHFIAAVIRRPDDATEIVSYWASQYGLHPLPNALKKGISLALGKFDAYQLAKYRAASKDLSLLDLVNLVKPKPTDRNRQALAALVAGELVSTDTWEARLSAGTDKTQAWEGLVREGKLGYMALLRNLRNISENVSDGVFGLALDQLRDEAAIRNSLVLPFRFYTAYRELQHIPGKRTPALMLALSQAAEIALGNVPQLSGTTLIALDVSGSMTTARMQPNGKRGMSPAEIGSLFAASMLRRFVGRAELITFDTDVRVAHLNPADSLLTCADRLVGDMRGGGTNMDLAFAVAEPFDRIIILSDMQAWTNGQFHRSYYGHKPAVSALDEYKQRSGANPHVYAFDLNGYGTMQFPASRCYQLAGFSDKVFDVMGMLEQDRGALVHQIEAVDF